MSISFESHHALFGGSFNPPHLGHLEAVQGLFKNPKVARVTILPSFGTPLKNSGISFDARFEMARLAFPELPVDAFERDENITYTWEVLSRLSKKYPKLAFVIGTDQFANLKRWNRFPEVLSMSDWIVLIRKPETIEQSAGAIRELVQMGVLVPGKSTSHFYVPAPNASKNLQFVETDARAISSTEIREKFSMGKLAEVKPLLPESVFEYIERNKLYGT